jgi:hypothetical protein
MRFKIMNQQLFATALIAGSAFSRVRNQSSAELSTKGLKNETLPCPALVPLGVSGRLATPQANLLCAHQLGKV